MFVVRSKPGIFVFLGTALSALNNAAHCYFIYETERKLSFFGCQQCAGVGANVGLNLTI